MSVQAETTLRNLEFGVDIHHFLVLLFEEFGTGRIVRILTQLADISYHTVYIPGFQSQSDGRFRHEAFINMKEVHDLPRTANLHPTSKLPRYIQLCQQPFMKTLIERIAAPVNISALATDS
ncbi:hypothetical protein CBL_00327 [Carabus blaptoides fortunei]